MATDKPAPDFYQVPVYCGCNPASPIRMACIQVQEQWGVHWAYGVYQCTVCKKKKKATWYGDLRFEDIR